MSAEGALRFARYAYPPNELGYCGPSGAAALLAGVEDDIARRARQFEGAWVYLEALAGATGRDDPLDDDLVHAYWVGSDLLDAVDPGELVARIERRFATQPGGTWRESGGRALAHHSYQVFEVYPWAAMLRAGLPPGPAVDVLDRCRVRAGTVVARDGEWVEVSASLLEWDGTHLTPGGRRTERARWSVDGAHLIDAPAVGDVVALHWDWVCEVLSPTDAARLAALEAAQRTAVLL